MPAISYKITIGSTTYKSQDNTILTRVMVHSAISIPVNTAEISLADTNGGDYKKDDAVTIELGSDGKTKKVFTGMVKSVVNSLNSVNIIAVSGMEALTYTYINMVFENKSTGDIFKDLVKKSKGAVGKVDDGVTFPRYIISGGKSVWRHLKLLGQYSGVDMYTDAEDKINFTKYKPTTGATFTYGEDILELEKEALSSPLEGVEVFGDSPAGQGQSEEANFWLKKEEVVGSAGKNAGVVARHAVYAARNKDLCGKIAANLFDASKVTATGQAVVLNGEGVALGQTITFKGAPSKGLDGSYKATAVKHLLNEEAGFTTEITWEEQE